jgi:hypothetical protein
MPMPDGKSQARRMPPPLWANLARYAAIVTLPHRAVSYQSSHGS